MRAVACLLWFVLGLSAALGTIGRVAQSVEPVPDRLVVLTFDDSSKSHHSVVRPILKKHGFGATFFVTEGFDFPTNKKDYMTWEEIAELHRDGFEIGNHTRDHLGLGKENVDRIEEQLAAIDRRCEEHGIPRPVTLAYPGNAFSSDGFERLRKHGVLFARRGGAPEYEYKQGKGFAYEPGLDHPLLVPSAGDARPDWELDDFIAAVEQARHGRIAVLQFHGVPDTAHSWVNSPVEKFDAYMTYLAKHEFTVVAMRDLAKFVDPKIEPKDAGGVIADRQRSIADGTGRDEFRRAKDDDELRYWLDNMLVGHGFTDVEAASALGMSATRVVAEAKRLGVARPSDDPAPRKNGERLRILPYPGGRHPRIGFLDGAIRPQRETKFSAFLPWDPRGYVVVDAPEAIWVATGEGRELLYLAHTHVPTRWSKRGTELPKLEWNREADGRLSIERELPDKTAFGATIEPGADMIRMELWLRNGTDQELRGLDVQNCVMLKGAPGFDSLTNENKVVRDPFVACREAEGKRWIVTAWENCARPWTNPPCPCMHSDPRFPDCPPGETKRLRGILSFYEGADIDGELARLKRKLGW